MAHGRFVVSLQFFWEGWLVLLFFPDMIFMNESEPELKCDIRYDL